MNDGVWGDTVCMVTTTSQGLQVLYTRQQIAARVTEMGAQITRDLDGEKLVMIGVLRGAAFFLSDLSRAIQVDATFDFVAATSYGKGRRSSGAVKLIKDLDEPIEVKTCWLSRTFWIPALRSAICARFFFSTSPNHCVSRPC